MRRRFPSWLEDKDFSRSRGGFWLPYLRSFSICNTTIAHTNEISRASAAMIVKGTTSFVLRGDPPPS